MACFCVFPGQLSDSSVCESETELELGLEGENQPTKPCLVRLIAAKRGDLSVKKHG